MKFLVSPNDEIKIQFALAIRKDGQVVGDISADMLKESFGDTVDPETIESHEAVFRRPNFADTVDMGNQVNTSDGIRFEVNPSAMRMARMCKLLKNWTLTEGEERKPVPPTAESIMSLEPVIAHIIGVQLDATVGV